jgi:hypothetical protein
MSTNFYLKPAPGSPLAVFCPLHIGLSAGGWSFDVQAYRHAGTPEGQKLHEVAPHLSVQVTVPATPAFKIESWADWKALILQEGAEVVSEYGDTTDKQAFITRVENDLHSTKGRWNHTHPLKNSLVEFRKQQHCNQDAACFDKTQYWLDADGYAVSICEFS